MTDWSSLALCLDIDPLAVAVSLNGEVPDTLCMHACVVTCKYAMEGEWMDGRIGRWMDGIVNGLMRGNVTLMYRKDDR